jgi:hypothetical protein
VGKWRRPARPVPDQRRRIVRRSTSGHPSEAPWNVKEPSPVALTGKKVVEGQPMQFAGLSTGSGNRLSRPQFEHRQTRLDAGLPPDGMAVFELVTVRASNAVDYPPRRQE